MTYGGISIPVREITVEKIDENPQPIREGRVGRRDRKVVRSMPIETLVGGMGVQYGSETEDAQRIAQSDGPWAHQDRKLTIPPIITTQNNLIASVDFSGYDTLDKRVLYVETTLGASGSGKPKLFACLGPYVLGPTSDTDAALVLYNTFTDPVTAVAETEVGGTDYVLFATKGGNDGVVGVADPLDVTSNSFDVTVTVLTLGATDQIDAIVPMPNLGNGKNIWVGSYGGVQGFWETDFTDDLDTPLSPAPGSATRGILPRSGAMLFTGVLSASDATNDASVGDVAWSNPDRVTASDNSRASAAMTAGQTTQRILVEFDFSGIPDAAIIEGLEVKIERTATGTSRDLQVQFYNGSTAIGDNYADLLFPWGSEIVKTYGNLRHDWFTGLRGSDLSTVTLAIRAVCTSNGTASIDYVSVSVAYKIGGVGRVYTTQRQGTVALNDPETISTATYDPFDIPANVLADDGSDATATYANGLTSRLFVGGYFVPGELPAGLPVDTVQVFINRSESNTAANVKDREVALYINGTAVSLNEADQATEWGGAGASTSKEDIYYNITTFVGMTTDDLPNLMVGYQAVLAANTALIDTIKIKVAYRELGVQEIISAGGEFGGVDPVVRNRFWMLAPERRGEAAGRNVPRKLYRVDASYTATDDRAAIDAVQVPTPFTYNRKPLIVDDELYVAGSQSSGPARSLARLSLFASVFDPAYEVRADVRLQPYLEISGFGQGQTEMWGITDLWLAGDSVGITLVTDANAIAQDYVIDHRTGALQPFGPRQALTTSTVFMPKGQTLVASETRARYRFIADNGTPKNLDVSRQYTLDDIHMDALVFLASQSKQAGDLATILPDFVDGFGDLPATKALIGAYCFSRDIPDDGYVKLYYSIDGGANWVLMATFAAFGGSETGRKILATPVAFQTIAFKIEQNRGATATANCNALPIYAMAVGSLPVARRFRVTIDTERPGFIGMENLRTKIKAKHDALLAQTCKIGTEDGLIAIWDDEAGALRPGDPDMRSEDLEAVLFFDEISA